jgi:hypothetical protein
MAETTKRGTPRLPPAVRQYAVRLGKAGLDYRAIRIARTEMTSFLSDEQKDIAKNSLISDGKVDWVMDKGRDAWSCRCAELAAGSPYDVNNMVDAEGYEIDCLLHPNCGCTLRPHLRTDEEIIKAFKEEMAQDLETIQGTQEQADLLAEIDKQLETEQEGKIIEIMKPEISEEQIAKLNDAGILVTSEKELKQGLERLKKHVENMEEDYRNVYTRYTETTKLQSDPLMAGIGYDPDKDTLVYNKRSLGISKYQQPVNVIYSHELAHRYDILEIKSWENNNFITAIDTAINKVQSDIGKYNDLYRSLENVNPAFQDILSALSDNKIKVNCKHESTYWAVVNNRALEIFANASYLQANHNKLPEFDGLLDDIMEISKTMFIKGAK